MIARHWRWFGRYDNIQLFLVNGRLSERILRYQ